MSSLVEFLIQAKDKITRTQRINERYARVGYSEYTQWDTLVDFDEIEIVDFEALMIQIQQFEDSFKK